VSQFFNLGKIRNYGAELAVDARVIEARDFVWDLAVSGSLTHNTIVELGVPPFYAPGSFYQRHVQGFPAGGFWGVDVSYNDANGDGIIAANEVTVGDQLHYKGPALPTQEASMNSSMGFFNQRVRLGAQFDYRGGHRIDNSIENALLRRGCRGLVDERLPPGTGAGAGRLLRLLQQRDLR
jgi:hypothetical protein